MLLVGNVSLKKKNYIKFNIIEYSSHPTHPAPAHLISIFNTKLQKSNEGITPLNRPKDYRKADTVKKDIPGGTSDFIKYSGGIFEEHY